MQMFRTVILCALSVCLWLVNVVAGQDSMPRVYLQAASHGNVWNAHRDQAMEMAKDFQKHCPDAKVTILQTSADYTVLLNHIEVGLFARDNQFQVANRDGDTLSLREKSGIKSGSIVSGVRAACDLILADWRAHGPTVGEPSATMAPSPTIAPSGRFPDTSQSTQAVSEPTAQAAETTPKPPTCKVYILKRQR
jgi:hypothetical protein